MSTPRLALSIQEACEALGVGETFFREKILPDIKAVRVGRRTLIPWRELEALLDRKGAKLHG
jgi:excisionase family DNA binding protein